MNTVIKIVFASALALSGAVPAFAGHASKMSHRADHSQVERVRTDAATDANATLQSARRATRVLILELAVRAERFPRPQHLLPRGRLQRRPLFQIRRYHDCKHDCSHPSCRAASDYLNGLLRFLRWPRSHGAVPVRGSRRDSMKSCWDGKTRPTTSSSQRGMATYEQPLRQKTTCSFSTIPTFSIGPLQSGKCWPRICAGPRRQSLLGSGRGDIPRPRRISGRPAEFVLGSLIFKGPAMRPHCRS